MRTEEVLRAVGRMVMEGEKTKTLDFWSHQSQNSFFVEREFGGYKERKKKLDGLRE